VKLAVDKVLHDKPDLCVSGINHGTNSSINVIYSGTMSAAMEAAIEGVDAIGFSNQDPSHDADLSEAAKYSQLITEQVLEHGLPDGTLLNVNIPAISEDNPTLQGMQVCRQAVAKWDEDSEERTDPRGRTYYWLAGEFVNYDKGEDADEWALAHNYVAITPVKYDLSAQHAISFINNKWDL
jgi:5'-nucleotidase